MSIMTQVEGIREGHKYISQGNIGIFLEERFYCLFVWIEEASKLLDGFEKLFYRLDYIFKKFRDRY